MDGMSEDVPECHCEPAMYDPSDSETESEGSDYGVANVERTHWEELNEKRYWTPPHSAAQWDHNAIVNLLMDDGARADVASVGLCDCVFPHHWTQKGRPFPKPSLPQLPPLHTAICHGHDSTAALLLSREASVLVTSTPGGDSVLRPTALHTACASGSTSFARNLIQQYQPDVEVRDHLGQSPVSYAYFTGMWDCIDLLVEPGCATGRLVAGEACL